MLQGLRVVVDVQHLYRPAKPNDRGSVFTLANGTKTTEGTAAFTYATSLVAWLEERGARVMTNEPARGILVGPYSRRHRAADAWDAHAYLACHVNAGGGGYTLAEHMALTMGRGLAEAIGPKIVTAFPAITRAQVRALSTTDRGAVCIREVPGRIATIICEPFFGDNPAHQGMLATPELVRLGTVIGEGVAVWWDLRQPI
jgi:N-acetylmuramoyl-L-alanine amidase